MVKDLIALTTTIVAVLGTTLVTASAQVPVGERFVVSGLVVLDGGDGSAWLQEPSLTGNQVVRVRRGDSLGLWRVIRILTDRVELEDPAGRVQYVILGGASAPDSRQRVEVTAASAAEARRWAQRLATGGDEGVWDDNESSSSPAAEPVLSPPIAPGHQ